MVRTENPPTPALINTSLPLRVLGDHLHRDGLLFCVLSQAALSPETENRNKDTHLKHREEILRFPFRKMIHATLKHFWKGCFQNTDSVLVIMCLICVYLVGR